MRALFDLRQAQRILKRVPIRLYSSSIPTPPSVSKLVSSEEVHEARRWVKKFENVKIERKDVDLSFARSSGPGGQNVNKVNSKAMIRVSLEDAWIPRWAYVKLKANPAFVSSSNSLLITSTTHRAQAANVEECLGKLHSLVLAAARSSLGANETSAEQQEHVQKLIRADKARLRVAKDKRSSIKQGRGKGGLDF